MSYCVRADIEDLFGIRNLEVWADLDNDADTDKIIARIYRAIAEADEELDNRLRPSIYTIPFNPVPPLITSLAARMAGVWLYEARGVKDHNPETGVPEHRLRWHVVKIKNTIVDLHSGVIRLDTATYTTVGKNAVPHFVTDD